MSEATVRQQRPIAHRDCEGFTQRQQKNKAWGAAGGKLNFASRGTEGIRGLGDSWEAISLASYFLTADRGIGSWPQSNNRIFFFLAYLGVIYKQAGGIFHCKGIKGQKYSQRIKNKDAPLAIRAVIHPESCTCVAIMST